MSIEITVDELRRLKNSGCLIDIGYSLLWDTRTLNWVKVVIK